jgi:hypothetical protein
MKSAVISMRCAYSVEIVSPVGEGGSVSLDWPMKEAPAVARFPVSWCPRDQTNGKSGGLHHNEADTLAETGIGLQSKV